MEKSIKEMNRIRFLEKFQLRDALMEWYTHPNMKFRVAFRNVLKNNNYCDLEIRSLKNYLHEHIYLMQQTAYIQQFVYMYDKFKKNIDESLNQSKNEYKSLKLKIDVNGIEKTTNPIKFIEIIRQAIVHNDETLSNNWSINAQGQIIINKLKKNGQRTNLLINIQDLIKLTSIFDDNVKDSQKGAFSLIVDSKKITHLIESGNSNVKKINKCITQKDCKTNAILETDDFQQRAIFNCLTTLDVFNQKTSKIYSGDPFDPQVLNKFYPAKDNRYSQINDLMLLVDILDLLETKNLSWQEMYNYLFNNTSEGYNKEYYLQVTANPSKFFSILDQLVFFDIITCVHPDSLVSYFPNVDVNSIRNSIVHGRFYYNYNGGYEFYDGVQELKHIASISRDKLRKSCIEFFYNTINDDIQKEGHI